jgi:hypothetical protein
MFELIKEWLSSYREIKPTRIEITPAEEKIIDEKTTQFAEELPLGLNDVSYASYDFPLTQDINRLREWLLQYRRFEFVPQVNEAIDNIVNEMVITNSDDEIVKINLVKCEDVSDKIKEKIEDAFKKILRLLKFNKHAYDIVRKWYVDGRIFYNVVVNPQKLSDGILKLIYIDAEKIQLFRDPRIHDTNTRKIFYRYENKESNQVFEIHPDLVVYSGSGFFDRLLNLEVSYIHKAIKFINNLRNIEDAIVIYRIVRSSEKLVFTVNTGTLPKTKAEEYIKSMSAKIRNKFVYNTNTGEVQTDKNTMLIQENFWFPQNAEGKGTTVSTLEGGKTLGELDDLYYFENKLWEALKIPKSRRSSNQERSIYNTGREIERDEIQFYKFILMLRNNFSVLFNELIKRELIWTKVISENEWNEIEDNIKYEYTNDNLYTEIKESELMQMRLQNLQSVNEYVGRYYTQDEIAINILKMTEDEWKKKQKKLGKDRAAIAKINNELMPTETFENPETSNEQEEDEKQEPENEPVGEQ